jgi:hypothetical protein
MRLFVCNVKQVVEFVVDFTCVMIETQHGLMVVEAWNMRTSSIRSGFVTPLRRWILFVSGATVVQSLYVTSQLYGPGYGLLVKDQT